MTPERTETNPNPELHGIRDAVLVQALWSERAGLNTDLFYSQLPQEPQQPSQEAIRNLAVLKIEEWCELVVALFDPTVHQATRLLELADMQGYTNHYAGLILRREAGERPTFSRDEAALINHREAEILHKSLEHPFEGTKVYTDDELRKMVDHLVELGVRHMAEHFEFVGYHPNGSTIAEIKFVQVLESVTKAIDRLRTAVESGKADKQLLKTVAREMFSFADHLPQQMRSDIGLEFLLPMYDSLDRTSRELFAYGTLGTLTRSMYVRDSLVVPETNQTVLVAGKNARNYPPKDALPEGWTYKQVRAVRDQFPDSILPPDFVLGQDTPETYLQRKKPQGSPAEVRHFESNDLR